MTLKGNALRFALILAVASVVLGTVGCESAPSLGGDKPLVRDVTPEDNTRIVLDETTVGTKELHGDQAAPAEPSPVPTEQPATEPVEKPDTEVAKTEEAVKDKDLAAPGVHAGPPPVTSSELADGGPDYKIQAGDVLEFHSLDDITLSRPNLVVRSDGYISLPFVPDIRVQGRTRQEATELVRQAYASQFKEPQVSVAVLSAISSTYYVLGQVQAPNEYPYTRPVSLLGAISKAGGLRVDTASAGQSYIGRQGQLVKAFIIRHVNDQREVFDVDLRRLTAAGPHPSETPVLPGDIIFVPEGLNLVYVLGEVGRSNVFPISEGMTLLQLLAAASGPNFTTARLSEVVIMREVDETHTRVMLVDVKRMLRTGRDFVVKPGDIVYIPRKRLVTAQEFVGRFTGTVSPIMSLYSQAFDTYYTKKRFDAIFDQPGGTNNVLGVLQGLRDFSVLLPVTPAVP